MCRKSFLTETAEQLSGYKQVKKADDFICLICVLGIE